MMVGTFVLFPSGPQLVLWLHILAACVWIGGQIVIGALVPILRRDRSVLVLSVRRFGWVGWIAFAVLILTGIANAHNAGISWHALGSTARGRTLSLKLGFVLLSGLAAAVHSFGVAPRAGSSARTRALSGILGAMSLLAAMLAALYGVVIAEA